MDILFTFDINWIFFLYIPGYPNLMSFMQAFPDIFIITQSENNNACTEVTVNKQCICE